MASLTLSQALDLAQSHQRMGRMVEAEKICRAILQEDPEQPQALHQLGSLVLQVGKADLAAEFFQRAALAAPEALAPRFSLGQAESVRGRFDEAIVAFRSVLQSRPDSVEAWFAIALAYQGKGELELAAEAYRSALGLRPASAELHSNLGAVLRKLGRSGPATDALREAIRLRPDFAEAHANLGLALQDEGKLDEAIAAFSAAINARPTLVEARHNLGVALQAMGRLEEAGMAYRGALQLRPDYVEALTNLGSVLKTQGQLDEAAACYGAVIQLRPDFAEARNNLGNVAKEQGLIEEALGHFRAALALRPESAAYQSNLILTQLYQPGLSLAAMRAEREVWQQRIAGPLAGGMKVTAKKATAGRPLRIGYVSSDFREHSVGRFLLPLFANHDAKRFQIFAYSDVGAEDAISARLRANVHTWRRIAGLADAAVADLIRADGIDVLVDLSMHTAGNRLTLFARKPAPVQVSYLAYPGTTGLDAIDYELSDGHIDPVEKGAPEIRARIVRLPDSYWCYAAPEGAPEINPLPALAAGYVTFGCLSSFCKINGPMLAAWGRLMRGVPRSRLLLHAHHGVHRRRLLDAMAAEQIDAGRIDFIGQVPLADYFRLCQRLDLALDTFPFNGATTTCDALWMGVPVVSLAGDTPVGRSGSSILKTAGLPEFVAYSVGDYVRIAGELALDPARLGRFRAVLRPRLRNSPLMDAPRFARNIEAAFAEMAK